MPSSLPLPKAVLFFVATWQLACGVTPQPAPAPTPESSTTSVTRNLSCSEEGRLCQGASCCPGLRCEPSPDGSAMCVKEGDPRPACSDEIRTCHGALGCCAEEYCQLSPDGSGMCIKRPTPACVPLGASCEDDEAQCCDGNVCVATSAFGEKRCQLSEDAPFCLPRGRVCSENSAPCCGLDVCTEDDHGNKFCTASAPLACLGYDALCEGSDPGCCAGTTCTATGRDGSRCR